MKNFAHFRGFIARLILLFAIGFFVAILGCGSTKKGTKNLRPASKDGLSIIYVDGKDSMPVGGLKQTVSVFNSATKKHGTIHLDDAPFHPGANRFSGYIAFSKNGKETLFKSVEGKLDKPSLAQWYKFRTQCMDNMSAMKKKIKASRELLNKLKYGKTFSSRVIVASEACILNPDVVIKMVRDKYFGDCLLHFGYLGIEIP